MEIDQILKTLDWLDEERRKDKASIAALQERVLSYEGDIDLANQQIRALSAEVARLTAIVGRIDQFDESILQLRLESKRRDEELEKQLRKSLEEAEKVRRVEMRAVDQSIADVRKGLEPISEIRRTVNARIDDVLRLDRSIEELRQKLSDLERSSDESARSYRLGEESRRQDTKRLTDAQGEISALRKRVDEQRAQVELLSNTQRKVDGRLNEVLTVEEERRVAQAKFLEQQALWQVERDRSWKEWVGRLEAIEKAATDVEAQLQAMDATHQIVKRSQNTLETLSERVERRINEITEIQRLTEERFRQEWTTFKADDQKRWTNYTLVQDEQRSESERQQEKITQRVTQLEDNQQHDRDVLNQMGDQTEKRLQSLLSLTHEWVANYERIMGKVR